MTWQDPRHPAQPHRPRDRARKAPPASTSLWTFKSWKEVADDAIDLITAAARLRARLLDVADREATRADSRASWRRTARTTSAARNAGITAMHPFRA